MNRSNQRWLLVFLFGLVVNCRSSEGESCICADDCRSGLVCTTPRGPVTNGCIRGMDLTSGVCRPGNAQNDGEVVPPAADYPLDPTKRDLGGDDTMFDTETEGVASTEGDSTTDGVTSSSSGSSSSAGPSTGSSSDSTSSSGSTESTGNETSSTEN